MIGCSPSAGGNNNNREQTPGTVVNTLLGSGGVHVGGNPSVQVTLHHLGGADSAECFSSNFGAVLSITWKMSKGYRSEP